MHSPPLSPAPTLDVRFLDNIAWPYRVERLVVVLDGAVLYHRSFSSFPGALSIAHLAELPAGDHTLDVLVLLRYPSGTLGTSCLLEAVRTKNFSANGYPIDVVLDVYASGVTESLSERVRLLVRMAGDAPPLDFETYTNDPENPCT